MYKKVILKFRRLAFGLGLCAKGTRFLAWCIPSHNPILHSREEQINTFEFILQIVEGHQVKVHAGKLPESRSLVAREFFIAPFFPTLEIVCGVLQRNATEVFNQHECGPPAVLASGFQVKAFKAFGGGFCRRVSP